MLQQTRPLTGGRNQRYLDPDAAQRTLSRWKSAAIYLLATALLLSVAGNIYVGSLPKEVPAVVKENADGSYAPLTLPATPDDAGTKLLLEDWITSCREGAPNPKALSTVRCLALLEQRESAPVIAELNSYDSALIASKEKVEPVIDAVDRNAANPYQYQIAWHEIVTDPPASAFLRPMQAQVTIAFSDRKASWVSNPLTNPFGMYVTNLQLTEYPSRKVTE